MTAAPGVTKAASCGAMAPHIPRMGLSFVCVLAPGHSGDHSAGMVQWSQALHAAAHPSITHTVEVGMTNDPRAQSEPPSLVEWLRIDADFQEHQLEHNIPMVPAAEDAPRLRAAADALEAQAAEIARLKSETHRALDRAYNSAREHEVLVQNNAALLTQLAATRAERDALAALVEVAKCPNCDGSGVIIVETTGIEPGCCGRPNRDGSCCGNPIPVQTREQEQQPCQWCDERAKALRAGQQKGEL